MRLFIFLAAVLVAAPVFAADAQPPAQPPAVTVVDSGVAAPTSAPAAPVAPTTIDEAVGTVQQVIASFKSEHVRAGIAGLITLLIFIWRRFLSGFIIGKIPSKYLAFVTAGVAFLAALPVALAASPWSWMTFVWQGLITGAEAMAFWSLFGKHLLARFLPSTK